MPVTRIDHVSLPTDDADRLLRFYERLGFGIEGEADWREGRHPTVGIVFDECKINVHPETMRPMRGEAWYVRGPSAEPGCGDLCVEWAGGLDELLSTLGDAGVAVIKGPVATPGSRQGMHGVSVYVRDPDENLLEFISYDTDDLARFPLKC